MSERKKSRIPVSAGETMSVRDRREKLRRQFDPVSDGKAATLKGRKYARMAEAEARNAEAVPAAQRADELKAKREGRKAPTQTKGAMFLASDKTPGWMKKHEGVQEIARAIDFDGGTIDTGKHDALKNGSWKTGSIRVGKVDIVKLHPPSKTNKYGSATVDIDRGGKYGVQRENMPLAQLADGVKQTMGEKSASVQSAKTKAQVKPAKKSTTRTIKPKKNDISIADIDRQDAEMKRQMIGLHGKKRGEVEWARTRLISQNSDIHIDDLETTPKAYPKRTKVNRRTAGRIARSGKQKPRYTVQQKAYLDQQSRKHTGRSVD